MDHDAGLARVARLLSDPARARILRTLLDGTMRPAGELAYAAAISAQSASGHLAKLVRGRLLAAEAQGRHRYFRIASPAVAEAVEILGSLEAAQRQRAPQAPRVPKSDPIQFLRARTCYDHLAGEVSVTVCEEMLKARLIVAVGRDFRVTPLGENRLSALGIEVGALRRMPRVFARACMDLTQRRPHLGGALGAALLKTYFERGWVLRIRRSRAVNITPKGTEGFRRLFA